MARRFPVADLVFLSHPPTPCFLQLFNLCLQKSVQLQLLWVRNMRSDPAWSVNGSRILRSTVFAMGGFVLQQAQMLPAEIGSLPKSWTVSFWPAWFRQEVWGTPTADVGGLLLVGS